MENLCFAPRQSRRAEYWKKAINSQCLHIDYLSLMNDDFELCNDTEYLVRIESPGECAATTRLLVELGGGKYEEEYGQFSNFDSWYLGWQIVLKRIAELKNQYQFTFINDPETIALAFDKKAVHHHLENKIKTPNLLGTCRTFEELDTLLSNKKYIQVFAKPRYGSSASGVMAIKKNKDQYVVYTSLNLSGNQLFNSIKLKKYNKLEDIKRIFDIANAEFIIEEWIPKMKYEGNTVDFRVIVIAGKVEFIIPRLSKHMITNIHLGNTKSDIQHFDDEVVSSITAFAVKTAEHFPGLGYAGLDILIDKNQKPFLIEINAFGDMLLNVYNHTGLTTYEREAEVLG